MDQHAILFFLHRGQFGLHNIFLAAYLLQRDFWSCVGFWYSTWLLFLLPVLSLLDESKTSAWALQNSYHIQDKCHIRIHSLYQRPHLQEFQDQRKFIELFTAYELPYGDYQIQTCHKIGHIDLLDTFKAHIEAFQNLESFSTSKIDSWSLTLVLYLSEST